MPNPMGQLHIYYLCLQSIRGMSPIYIRKRNVHLTKNYMKIRILFLALIVMGSCVPKKEFEKIRSQREDCLEMNASLSQSNRQLQVENRELDSRVDVLKDKNQQLASDSMRRAKNLLSYKRKNERLQDKYESLQATQEKLLKGTSQETKELLSEIQ